MAGRTMRKVGVVSPFALLLIQTATQTRVGRPPERLVCDPDS